LAGPYLSHHPSKKTRVESGLFPEYGSWKFDDFLKTNTTKLSTFRSIVKEMNQKKGTFFTVLPCE
jgi:hypothetical protein